MPKKVKIDDIEESLKIPYGIATLDAWAKSVGTTLDELTNHVDECRNRDAIRGAGRQTPQRSLMYSRRIAADMIAFLHEYQDVCTLTTAAGAIKSTPRIIRYWRQTFPVFDAMCSDIQEAVIDYAEDELYRRAVVGENTNVYHQGVVVDVVKKKSDDLLKFLLNGNRNKFRNKSEVAMTGANGGPLDVRADINIESLREKLFERLLTKAVAGVSKCPAD